MIAVLLIAGLTLLVALYVGHLIVPSSHTLTVNTFEQPWPYLAGLSARVDASRGAAIDRPPAMVNRQPSYHGSRVPHYAGARP
jgi:hypothetical protein